jgi:hypothetical protein
MQITRKKISLSVKCLHISTIVSLASDNEFPFIEPELSSKNVKFKGLIDFRDWSLLLSPTCK